MLCPLFIQSMVFPNQEEEEEKRIKWQTLWRIQVLNTTHILKSKLEQIWLCCKVINPLFVLIDLFECFFHCNEYIRVSLCQFPCKQQTLGVPYIPHNGLWRLLNHKEDLVCCRSSRECWLLIFYFHLCFQSRCLLTWSTITIITQLDKWKLIGFPICLLGI